MVLLVFIRGKDKRSEGDSSNVLHPRAQVPWGVVHYYSQFYGKIFWNKAIARTNLKSDSTSEFKK